MARKVFLLAIVCGLLGLPARCHAGSDEPGTVQGEKGIEKPINLWPLYYSKRGKDSSELELIFSLFTYAREGRRTSFSLRPLFSRKADPDRNIFETNVLWPLSHYFREGDRKTFRVLPLLWHRSDLSRTRSFFFPIYSFKRDDQYSRLGLIGYSPVTLCDFQKDKSIDMVKSRVIIFGYAREGVEKRINLWPIYSQATKPQRGSVTLLPVFSHRWDHPSGFRRFSLIGLPDTFNLFEFKKDSSRDLLQWHFANVFSMRRGVDHRLVFFPLYWRSEIEGDEIFHVWPFYGYREKGTSREYSTIYPFFRYKANPDEEESDLNLLWPLLRRHSFGAYSHNRFLPLYAHTSNTGSADKPGLLPLAMISPLPLHYKALGKGYLYERFIWLCWREKTGERRREVILNYYDFDNYDDDRRHRGFFPFWHQSRWGERQIDYGFPLFASYRSPSFSFRTFFPLHWDYRSRGASGARATRLSIYAPLFYRYGSDTFSWTSFFPFYFHTRDKDTNSELYYYFPVYGTYRRGDTFRRHLLFFPLYSRLKDEASGLSSFDIAWPILHYETSPERSSFRFLPLVWYSRRPEFSLGIGFPLFWHFSRRESSHKHFVPFYGSYRRGNDLSFRYILGPLYIETLRPAKGFKRVDFLGSLFSRTVSPEETKSHLFPFYWRRSSRESSSTLVLPVCGGERIGGSFNRFFVLGFHSNFSLFSFAFDRRDKFSKIRAINFYRRRDKASSFTTFFPLYWSWKNAEEKGSILFPLYARQTFPAEDRGSISILGLPEGLSVFDHSWDLKAGRRSTRALIFYRSRDKDISTLVAFPLLWQRSEADYFRSSVYPFYHFRREGGDRTRRALGILGFTPKVSLFAYEKSDGDTRHRFWPLYFSRRDGLADYKEFSAFGIHPFLSLIRYQSGTFELRHRFFPVYSYVRGEEEKKVSILWPVVSYKSGEDERELAFLWRFLYFSRKGAEKRDFRFLWRFVKVSRDRDSSDFEFNPFYFRISQRGKGSYWAVLGGLFGVETKPTGEKKIRFLWVF